MDKLPLLLFPKAKIVTPPPGYGGGSKPHCPERAVQISRLSPQLDELERSFQSGRDILSKTIEGYEPEFVLVIETAGRINAFEKALEKAGLEWIADWDSEYESNEEFYEVNEKGQRKENSLQGRLYLSMSNQHGLQKLLQLWKNWKAGKSLPFGMTLWEHVFQQTLDIRRWGIQEQLIETGVINDWKLLIEDGILDDVTTQIELFFRNSEGSRRKQEISLSALLVDLGAEIVSDFIVISDIRFHAVKARIPVEGIKRIISEIEQNSAQLGILYFPGIMYYRQTGQSVSTSNEEITESASIGMPPIGDPVVAILDGVPYHQHDLLKDRLIIDDPDDLSSTYQLGERKHGTAMASLVIHGELDDSSETTLSRPVYFRPIMEMNSSSREWGRVDEYIPDHIFYEDRIERAVRRIFEGEGNTPAIASSIKIINLSFGDSSRQFEHTLSPCARLIDWLSWKYKVLFCVSAGNYTASIDLGINAGVFSKATDEYKCSLVIRRMAEQASLRRILSPAETINNITVGALHFDNSAYIDRSGVVDILPGNYLPSPISRLGYGFRKSVKPEILVSGGRQIYSAPLLSGSTEYSINASILSPGHKVATDSKNAIGSTSGFQYTRGTSNATALATHGAAKIHDIIEKIREDQPDKITDDQVAILIKTLMVHGAIKDSSNIKKITGYLDGLIPAKKEKQYISKFLGYGEANFNRVLSCAEQRATVIGCASIKEKQQHEYRLPLPPSLSNQKEWRRLTITLAWFSPINAQHRYFRKAKLNFLPPKESELLRLKRCESDYNQVQRGTVQHEVLESEKVSAYQDGDSLVISVVCKADATEYLDEEIDYALAVTLEVKEGINLPIYQEIRTRVQAAIQVSR